MAQRVRQSTSVLWRALTFSFLALVSLSAAERFDRNPLPRHLTAEEMEFVRQYPLMPSRAVTPPPTGDVHCVAEYEPMDGILLAFPSNFSASWAAIQYQIAAQITTTGDAEVYAVVHSWEDPTAIVNAMIAAGADGNRIHTMVVDMNSIWIRDYGPRYIIESGCRAIVDHTYNRPRPLDDAIPAFFAEQMNHALYELPLVHGGGNYHLHATGIAHATRLINNENPGLTETEIHDIWADYQNVDTWFYTPFPIYVDSTQHIDMWLQTIADDALIISDWPSDPGSTQDVICDTAAADLSALGYTITRVPARSLSDTHYTYTNVVLCNDVVLIPTYTHPQMASHNAEALAAFQSAMPSKTIVQIDCEDLVWASGVMHCIVMHLPRYPAGEDPTAYLKTRLEGASLTPNDSIDLSWISDDDEGTLNVDLLMSLNSGLTFDVPIAIETLDDGHFLWTVPEVFTQNGRLKIIVRDHTGHQGTDETEIDFTVDGNSCPADCAPPGNPPGDGMVDLLDLLAEVAGWRSEDLVLDIAPIYGPGDFGDGWVNVADAVRIINDWGACPE